MKVYNVPNIIPANTVLNATIDSQVLQCYQMFGYAIQIVFTGTPSGNFSLQSSVDPVPQVWGQAYAPINWTTVANSTFTVSGAGNVEWNVTDVMYNYVRVVYTDTSSGTSTAIVTSATFNGKGVT